MADKSNDARRAQGNRPADNSTHATAASISAQKNWQGGNSAEDFLGLNAGPADPEPAPPIAAQRIAPPSQPVNEASWLMDTEQAAPEQVPDEENPPTEDAYEDEESFEEAAEESFDDGSVRAPAVLDASWTEPRHTPASKKRPMLLAAGAVVVLAAGAFVFLRQARHGQTASNTVTEVAQAKSPLLLKQPKQPATTDLETPKSPTSSAPNGGSGRLAVDRTGHTQPVAIPEVVAQNDTDVAPPAAVQQPAAKPQASAPQPQELAPQPKAVVAQVVEGPSKEMLKGLVNSMRGKIVRGEYAETQTAFDKIEGHLVLAENDPLRKDLVSELRRLDKQAAELVASENSVSNTKTGILVGAASSPAKPSVGPAISNSVTARPKFQPPTKSASAPGKSVALAGVAAGLATGPEIDVAPQPTPLPAPNAVHPSPEVGSVNALGSAGLADAEVATGEVAAAASEAPPSEIPSVRVLNARSQPIGEGSGQRPNADEHLTTIRTEAPELEPADLRPEVASQSVPVAPTVAAPTPAHVPSEPVQAPAVASREGSLDASDVLLPPAPINGVRVAQGKDMDTIWTGETVPMDRVDAPVKVMTPLVGNVRVHLKTKEVFEGRLYAVGENSVWIEGPFGRMGLANERIASVDKVEPPPGAGATSKDPKAAPKNDRVKLKTPGGIVFGKLISSDGPKSMVVTDSGLKLTVDTKELEFVVQPPKIVIKKAAPKG